MRLPALYAAADSAALVGQQRYLVALRLRLGGLFAAAVTGVASFERNNVEWAGLAALIAFLVALGAESYTALLRPDRLWYEGRAAAESVKTIAWRYAVQGAPFEGRCRNKMLTVGF